MITSIVFESVGLLPSYVRVLPEGGEFLSSVFLHGSLPLILPWGGGCELVWSIALVTVLELLQEWAVAGTPWKLRAWISLDSVHSLCSTLAGLKFGFRGYLPQPHMSLKLVDASRWRGGGKLGTSVFLLSLALCGRISFFFTNVCLCTEQTGPHWLEKE